MAGRGPAPKPANRRSRSKATTVAGTQLTLVRAGQPELPAGVDWHAQTVAWWQMWGQSPLSKDFTEADWSFLLDTAVMHSNFWSGGHWTLAAEIRLRVAKFGQTPEDRARLRIVFADADEKDERRASRAPRASFQGLRAVD